jgi:hypothetical protein
LYPVIADKVAPWGAPHRSPSQPSPEGNSPSCNRLCVHPSDSVLHSHQVAARCLSGVAGSVLGEVCLMDTKQESNLPFQTLDYFWADCPRKLHTSL